MRLGKREIIGGAFLLIILAGMFYFFMLPAITYHCPKQVYPISPQHPAVSCMSVP